MVNLNSNVRNTENSELHRYFQKELLSLLHQFPFEQVTFKHEQVGDYNSKRALHEFCLCKPCYCCKFGCCCNRFWIFFFLNNVSIRYNMLLLHRILIQYCLNLQINMFTTYMNANFNKMLETLIFQRSYAQHLYQKHIP